MPTFTFSINKNKKNLDYNIQSVFRLFNEFFRKISKEEQYILFILFLFMVLITKTFQNIIANCFCLAHLGMVGK